MKKPFKNPPILLSSVSSFIYLIVSISICIKTKSNIFEYIAALLPLFIILASTLLSLKHNLFGGILLTIEGVLILYFFLKNFNFIEVITVILLFGVPVTVSGLMLVFKSIMDKNHCYYELKGIYRNNL